MRYYSEKTGKLYDTPEAIEAAEKAYDKEKKELEKAKEEKRLAAKRVEDAYAAVNEARKKADEELSKFCEKYGAYHATVKEANVRRPSDILDDLLDRISITFPF